MHVAAPVISYRSLPLEEQEILFGAWHPFTVRRLGTGTLYTLYVHVWKETEGAAYCAAKVLDGALGGWQCLKWMHTVVCIIQGHAKWRWHLDVCNCLTARQTKEQCPAGRKPQKTLFSEVIHILQYNCEDAQSMVPFSSSFLHVRSVIVSLAEQTCQLHRDRLQCESSQSKEMWPSYDVSYTIRYEWLILKGKLV